MSKGLFPRIIRGDIYYVDFGNQPGSVVHGIRPAMVVQNDTGNWHAPTLIVAAITTEIKKLRQDLTLPSHNVAVCCIRFLTKLKQTIL